MKRRRLSDGDAVIALVTKALDLPPGWVAERSRGGRFPGGLGRRTPHIFARGVCSLVLRTLDFSMAQIGALLGGVGDTPARRYLLQAQADPRARSLAETILAAVSPKLTLSCQNAPATSSEASL